LFGDDPQACIAPGVEPAFKRPDIPIAALPKLLRQTGAGTFIRSSAISDNGLVFWNFVDVLFKAVEGNAKSSWHHDVGLSPSFRIARVNHREILTCRHALAQVINRDSDIILHIKASLFSLAGDRYAAWFLSMAAKLALFPTMLMVNGIVVITPTASSAHPAAFL
jgi:hypothetical protein